MSSTDRPSFFELIFNKYENYAREHEIDNIWYDDNIHVHEVSKTNAKARAYSDKWYPPPLPTLKDNKLALGGPVFQLASIL